MQLFPFVSCLLSTTARPGLLIFYPRQTNPLFVCSNSSTSSGDEFAPSSEEEPDGGESDTSWYEGCSDGDPSPESEPSPESVERDLDGAFIGLNVLDWIEDAEGKPIHARGKVYHRERARGSSDDYKYVVQHTPCPYFLCIFFVFF